MRVCVVGSGYVGLVTAACLADSGNHVVAVDSDAAKIRVLERGECPIFEPGLGELIRANLAAGRLRFTQSLAEGVAGATIIFLAVGTPSGADGAADLSALEAAVAQVAAGLSGPAIVVIKSTVPVGTGARVQALLEQKTSHAAQVVSNPEFLKEGAAVEDFVRPDRVVIGAEDPAAGQTVAELYRPFVLNNKPIMIMSRSAAELSKYASNAYLATRISFINEIADVCDRLGVDVDQVRRAMGADTRIGNHFLYPGVGYGGSCFPKDVQALSFFGSRAGAECGLLDSVHRRNLAQRRLFVERIFSELGDDLRGRRLVVWGLAFKPNTDDVRDAPAIEIVRSLSRAGAAIAVHDPHALEAASALLGGTVQYCPDAYAPIAGADALITLTEWMEYRTPDFERLRGGLKQPLIFDGRNMYDPEVMRQNGFRYHSVGRPRSAAAGAGRRDQ